jgi:hypothetical protein
MRIERKIWSAHRGDFIATGETMDVDINAPGRESKSSVSSGRFLKGPIPWFWVTAAMGLPGRALPVGLCLWRLVGAMRSDTVSFGNADLRPLGIDRAAKSRALRALERAGLIAVVHQPGRFPRVTVLRDYEPRDGCRTPVKQVTIQRAGRAARLRATRPREAGGPRLATPYVGPEASVKVEKPCGTGGQEPVAIAPQLRGGPNGPMARWPKDPSRAGA